MLVKPDVKGALAHSTTAQMGFMILTCGLGLWAAAVIHLMAHGFYKATLFLSSGRRSPAAAGARRCRPPHSRTRGNCSCISAAVVVPAAALAARPHRDSRHVSRATPPSGRYWPSPGSPEPRRPGAGSAAAGTARRDPRGGFPDTGSGRLCGDHHPVGDFLAPAMPAGIDVRPRRLGGHRPGLDPAGALAAIRLAPGAGSLRRAVYTRALTAGHIPTPPSPHF